MNDMLYVDLSYLKSISDGDDELIKELIEIFLLQAPEFEEGLLKGFNDKNYLQVASMSHKAKSSVLSMGMDDLGNVILKNIELIAKYIYILNNENQNISLSDNQKKEIDYINQSFDKYPKERIDWVKVNAKDEVLLELINEFKSVLGKASIELNNFLEHN